MNKGKNVIENATNKRGGRKSRINNVIGHQTWKRGERKSTMAGGDIKNSRNYIRRASPYQNVSRAKKERGATRMKATVEFTNCTEKMGGNEKTC